MAFGFYMSNNSLPDWDAVLSAAAHLQTILPNAVLVGGSASAVYAQHRMSVDADHVLTNLREQFDLVLAQLESVSGWQTARIQRPVQILGKLDGIETGIRQLIRDEPLETAMQKISVGDATIEVVLPTPAEILRIKCVLILKRNATRDYLDVAALSKWLGVDASCKALASFDALYPQPNGESALMQLQIQLARPLPYDLDGIELAEYKHLSTEWQRWESVETHCQALALALFRP